MDGERGEPHRGAAMSAPAIDVLHTTADTTGAVEEVWQQVVPSAKLHRLHDTPVPFRWASAATEEFSAVAYTLAGTVSSTTDPRDQFMVCRLATPRGRVRLHTGEADVSLPWAVAGTPSQGAWDGTGHVRALIFDLAYAERTARQLTGDDRLVLRVRDGSPDVALARQWERTHQYVLTAMTRAEKDGPAGATIAAEMRRHALKMSLLAFAEGVSPQDDAAQRIAAPAVVRRARSYIDEHAHEPITVDDVAAAAAISTRGLQYAFRRALDTTPTEYLRRVRLTGVHEDLRARRGESVGEISRRWGFSNPSRFARAYREVYGVSPGVTWRES